MNIVINGWNITDKTSGVERYALEIMSRLDKLFESDNVMLLTDPRKKRQYSFSNIKVIPLKCSNKYIGKIELWLNVMKNKAVFIDFCNGFAIGSKAIVTRHDMFVFYDYIGISQWRKLKSQLRANQAVRKAKAIVTVSEYAKQEIIRHTGCPQNKINVISNGWQHFTKVDLDYSVIDKLKLEDGKYFLFVGRLVKNKNISWIFKEADCNLNDVFVISGELKEYENFSRYYGKNNNILYTGYVTDNQMAALYKKCKAFLFPSIMEGFGVPPMEALYYGKPIIISNTSSLPEIYEGTAHYINPYKYDYDLNKVLSEDVSDPSVVLNKYDWDKSAQLWFSLIKKIYVGETDGQ